MHGRRMCTYLTGVPLPLKDIRNGKCLSELSCFASLRHIFRSLVTKRIVSMALTNTYDMLPTRMWTNLRTLTLGGIERMLFGVLE